MERSAEDNLHSDREFVSLFSSEENLPEEQRQIISDIFENNQEESLKTRVSIFYRGEECLYASW